MMKDIILIGSGQHAEVVLYNIKEQAQYKAIGILDNDPGKIGKTVLGLPVIADYSDISIKKVEKEYHTNRFVIGFGNMKYRKIVFQTFIRQGWEPVNIIHPNAVVSPSAQLGKGILIEAGCLVTPSPIIGDNVVINTGSQVNHDNILEDHVYIASGVILSGSVFIGENTLIDDGVIVSLGKKIGKNCIIGAGSVVTKDIGDDMVAYGNPCKIIRKNDD